MKLKYISVSVIFILHLFSFGQFGEQNILTSSNGPLVSPTIVDLNGDGRPDFLSGWFDSPSKIQWNENLGNSKFSTEQVISTTQNGLNSICSGDLDNDGDIEVIASGSTSGVDKISYYDNLGDGQFSSEIVIDSTINNPYTVRVVDINGDSFVDILRGNTDGTVYWYENLGSSLFSSGILLPTISGELISALTPDVDSDGDFDLIFCLFSLDKIVLYENLGGGIFGSVQTIDSYCNGARNISMADFDGDLDLDLIGSAYNADTISWYENLGSASFGPEQFIGTINAPSENSAIDYDNDGDLDVVLGTAGTGSKVVLYENLGSQIFDVAQIISSQVDDCYSSGVSDLDDDGDIDVYSGSTGDRKIAWYQNDGNGNFGAQLGIQTKFDAASHVLNIDFDIDGDIDIITNSGPGGKKVWFENHHPDKFVSERIITTANFFSIAITVADIDSDIDNDYIVAFNDDSIAWYENTGNCFFPYYHIITTQVDGVSELQVADIDSDGDPDVVSCSTQDDKIAWYENLGGGTFGPQIIISTLANTPRCIVTSDIDSDGDIDIVSTSMNDDKVALYENLSGGIFGPQQVISADMDEAWALATGDMDEDGDLDVIASASFGSKVSWFENLGNLNFGPEQILTNAYDNVWDLIVNDIDEDGDSDVAYLSYSWGIYWQENIGGGNFGPPAIITTEIISGQRLDFGDLDNDGDGDISSASSTDKKIAWYENLKYGQTQISGRMFVDVNQNFIHDSTDVGISSVGVVSSPLSDFSFTFSNGNYFMNFSDLPANYLVQPQALNNWSIVTDSTSYFVNIDSSYAYMDSLDFGFYPDTLIHELNAELVGGFPRCNQIVNYWLNFQNIGTTVPSGSITLTLADSISFVSSVIAPDSLIGQTIYWSFDSLQYFSSEIIPIYVQMPDFLSIGNTLTSILEISVLDTNGTVSFSTADTLDQILVCAYDPNDKISDPVGIDTLGFISLNTEEIEYTIRFQNTGNDTALNVIIKDQLDPNLDWETLTPLCSSHNMLVSVDQDGEITFKFSNIMLPDSNTNELASHGFVKYRVKLLQGLTVGTSIYNTANIYFDQNPPVSTNTKILTLYDCGQILQGTSLNSSLLCFNDSLNGSIPASLSDVEFIWNVGNLDTIYGSTAIWQADTSGIFNLSISGSNNFCSEDTAIQITVLPEILLNHIGTVTICAGQTQIIFGNQQSTSGIYYDTIQTTNGCDSVRSQQLEVLPLPSVNLNDLSQDTLCVYSNALIISATPPGGNYSGDGVTSNQFNPSIAGEGTHYIYYNYTDVNGCSATDSTKVFVDGCLGIDQQSHYAISIYPNPFKDYTTIFFGQELNGNHSVIIYDLLGQVVYSVDNVKGNQLEIRRNKMNAGVYIISLVDSISGQEVYTTKLIVE
jgi:uncharacterized repeat protein (TIGR01451 family)